MKPFREIPILKPNQLLRWKTKLFIQGTNNDCWEWIGTRNKLGYGTFSINHDEFLASRVALSL